MTGFVNGSEDKNDLENNNKTYTVFETTINFWQQESLSLSKIQKKIRSLLDGNAIPRSFPVTHNDG